MTLYPLLRPGSFVQIDPSVRKVQPMRWRTEFDRPIYFVELRDGDACSWCELQDGHLLLLPHPLSPRGVRRLAHGSQIDQRYKVATDMGERSPQQVIVGAFHGQCFVCSIHRYDAQCLRKPNFRIPATTWRVFHSHRPGRPPGESLATCLPVARV